MRNIAIIMWPNGEDRITAAGPACWHCIERSQNFRLAQHAHHSIDSAAPSPDNRRTLVNTPHGGAVRAAGVRVLVVRAAGVPREPHEDGAVRAVIVVVVVKQVGDGGLHRAVVGLGRWLHATDGQRCREAHAYAHRMACEMTS